MVYGLENAGEKQLNPTVTEIIENLRNYSRSQAKAV